MVDEEELQFHEEYMNEQDPSILHFLLASGDDVGYLYLNHWPLGQEYIHYAPIELCSRERVATETQLVDNFLGYYV